MEPSLLWSAAVASVLICIGTLLIFHTAQRASIASNEYAALVTEATDQHIASLAAAAPPQVISSDRHTVKPWFQGKLPFSFNLPENLPAKANACREAPTLLTSTISPPPCCSTASASTASPSSSSSEMATLANHTNLTPASTSLVSPPTISKLSQSAMSIPQNSPTSFKPSNKFRQSSRRRNISSIVKPSRRRPLFAGMIGDA